MDFLYETEAVCQSEANQRRENQFVETATAHPLAFHPTANSGQTNCKPTANPCQGRSKTTPSPSGNHLKVDSTVDSKRGHELAPAHSEPICLLVEEQAAMGRWPPLGWWERGRVVCRFTLARRLLQKPARNVPRRPSCRYWLAMNGWKPDQYTRKVACGTLYAGVIAMITWSIKASDRWPPHSCRAETLQSTVQLVTHHETCIELQYTR